MDASSGTFNWTHFQARCVKLNAHTADEQASLAGLSRRTYFRLKAGKTSLRLDRLALVAARLGTTSIRLQMRGQK